MTRKTYETPKVVSLGSSKVLVNGSCTCRTEMFNYKPAPAAAVRKV